MKREQSGATRLVMRLALAVLAVSGVVAMAPATASAAPVGVTAQQYVSYRVAFDPNQALSVGGFGSPVTVSRYDLQFGIADWHKEGSFNGFRLHSRFYHDSGLDYCLAGSGTRVFEEECAASPGSIRQNWQLVTTGGISRLRHAGTALYLTYPAGAKGAVFLAQLSTVTTQAFTERNEGVK